MKTLKNFLKSFYRKMVYNCFLVNWSNNNWFSYWFQKIKKLKKP